MANAVDTAMKQVKSAAINASLDLPDRQAETPELLAGHDAVLAQPPLEQSDGRYVDHLYGGQRSLASAMPATMARPV